MQVSDVMSFIYMHEGSVLRTLVKVNCPCAFIWSRCHEGVLGDRILNLRTRWRWVVSFMSRPLYPQGKSSCYSLDRRFGGPQNRPGHGDE